MELDRVLKQLLAERDLNLAQLSRATKVPVQTLHNWINGHKPRDIDQVKRVADYFKVSMDYVLYNRPQGKMNPMEQYKDEINAGVFEVILRKI